MSISNGPFHVVKHLYNDKFTTYAVYVNNRVFLRPSGKYTLGKWAAYAIAALLNSQPRTWPEQPMTREQLLAAHR